MRAYGTRLASPRMSGSLLDDRMRSVCAYDKVAAKQQQGCKGSHDIHPGTARGEKRSLEADKYMVIPHVLGWVNYERRGQMCRSRPNWCKRSRFLFTEVL